MIKNIKRKILLFLGNPKLRTDFNINQIKKILLYPSAGIGDSIVFTPTIRALKKKYQKAQIIVMTCRRNKGVFIGNPYISHIINYSFWSFIKYRNKIDVFVDLNIFIRKKTFILYRILNPKLLLTGYREVSFGLKEKDFSYFKNFVSPPDNQHTYKTFLFYLKSLNISDDGKGYDLYVNDKYFYEAENFWMKGKVRVLINLFGAYKVLDKKNILDLSDNIHKEFFDKVDMAVSWEEKNKEYIESFSKESKGVRLLYKTDVEQLIALVKTADFIISVDTGIVHIASAFSKNMISFYEESAYVYWKPINKEAKSIICDVSDIWNGKKIYNFDSQKAFSELSVFFRKHTDVL